MRAALIQAYYRRQGIDALGVWGAYEARQWLAPAAFRLHCESLFEQAIAYASRECEFYRARGCSSDPATFASLSKREIMDHQPALTVERYRNGACFRGSTSGTTGRVLDVLVDQRERAQRLGAAWRGDGFPAQPGGRRFEPWCPTAMLWGNTAVVKGGVQGLTNRTAAWLFRKQVLNFFQVNPRQLRGDYAAVARLRPRRIIGYVAALCAMAAQGLEQGWAPLRAEKVVPTAEQLDAESAALISRFFLGPQRQRYGCREAGDIAAQCEFGTWHVYSDFLYPEVRLADGSIAREGSGTLLLTKLHNRVMPLIRYDIEDLVTLGGPPCACGRSLPVMQSIDGRYIDQLVCRDGSRINGLAVPRVLRGISYYEFQAVQEKAGECTLLLVPRLDFSAEQEARLAQAWQEFIGPALSFRLELVDEIPATASGKRRQVLSKLLQGEGPPGAASRDSIAAS